MAEEKEKAIDVDKLLKNKLKGLSVGELEAGPLHALDVVDLGADEIHQAHLIADQAHALRFEGLIRVLDLIEVEVIGKPRTPAPLHFQA